MNLIKNIEEHFNEHQDYDELTKIRYIYLYICKVFSYDTRFYSQNPRIKREIYNKKIDPKNVTDFDAVCFSISCALKEVLEYFGFESELVSEESDAYSHTYVVTECMNNNMPLRLKLDPTIKHDLARVKLDSLTLGFVDLDDHNNFLDSVAFSDQKIKESEPQIDHDVKYDTIQIKKLNEVIDQSAKNRGLLPQEIFFEKLEYLQCLINTRDDITTFDDMSYYLSYIITNFNINDNPKDPYIKPAVFYKGEDYKDMILLMYVKYLFYPESLYLMKKGEKGISMDKISKEKGMELLDEYYSPECQYLFETLIEKMPSDSNSKTM